MTITAEPVVGPRPTTNQTPIPAPQANEAPLQSEPQPQHEESDRDADPKPEAAKGSDDAKKREEIRDAVKSKFLDRLIGKSKAKPEKQDAPEAKAEDAAPAPDTGKPESEAQPEKPVRKASKKAVARERQPITEADMVRVASEAATKAAAEVSQKASPGVPRGTQVPEEPELSGPLAKEIPIYKRLAEMEPVKYGKIIKQVAEFSAKEDKYRRDWQAQNPGAEFDPEADEHNEFFNSNFPPVDPDDFEAAKESVIEERAAARAEELVAKKLEEKFGPDIKRVKQERAEAALRPVLESTLQAAAVDILEAIDKEYAPLGKTLADMQKLGERDPMAADVAERVCSEKMPLLVEIKKLHARDDKGDFLFPFDPSNPAHSQISRLADEAERSISGMDKSDKVDNDGREFATRLEFGRMTPTEQKAHWFLDESQMTNIVLAEARRQASDDYAAKKKQHERYTGKPYTPPGKAVKSSQEPKQVDDVKRSKLLVVNSKPESPSVGAGPVGANGSNGSSGGPNSGVERFFSRLSLK